jgi:hypothetical protein
MPIELVKHRYLKSTILLENKKQAEMGLKKVDEQEIDFTFDYRYVTCWYRHEFGNEEIWDRTLVYLSSGDNFSLKCTVEEFEKVFLKLA